MSVIVIFLIFLILSLLILYIYSKYRFGFWKRKGIYSPDAAFPFGHLNKSFTGQIQVGIDIQNLYEETKHLPFVGMFMSFKAAIMINDLDLLKSIFIKDFSNFRDRGTDVDPEIDPFSRHLLNMEGNEWRDMRLKLVSTFTSSKMRYMFGTMMGCVMKMENYLETQVESGKIINLKDVLSKYGMDVIGSCAFGLEIDCFKYPDSPFRKMGKRITNPGFINNTKLLLIFLFPILAKTFRLRSFPIDMENFFVKIVNDTIKHREENNVVRNDFMQLLIDLKKEGEEKALTSLEMAAQTFFFFIAGFETSASTASYVLYELARNPDIQKKLVSEIDRTLKENDGKYTYDSILSVDYLTQVIHESLRMYPPIPFLTRRSEQDYLIPGTQTVIEKGTQVIIPVLGIHRDSKIHENPMKFDPDRFKPENVSKRHNFSTIPFGEGPRDCIGKRFGMLQARLSIFSILSKYEVSVCEKTSIPLEIDPISFILQPLGDQYFRLTKRTKQ